MEGSTGANKNNTCYSTPKLRNYRKQDSRWGIRYHTAMSNAIFAKQHHTNTCPIPPSFMFDERKWHESLYLCKECNDCFYLKSSYEDHISRHSWILGYWCHHCFLTVCKHTKFAATPFCPACFKLDRDKRAHFRRRSIDRSKQVGVPKIFYNQCQFFAHLKSHSVGSVDIADLMLIPIPVDLIGSTLPAEFDVTCAALVEYAFSIRKHLSDWLESQNVEHNWWLPNTNITIANIIRDYKDSCEFLKSAEHSSSQSSLSELGNYSMKNNSNKSIKFSKTSNDLSLEDVKEEFEDNPYISADITFVDCGPAQTDLVPELPVYNTIRKQTTILVKPKQELSPNKVEAIKILQSKRKKVNRILSKCASPNMPISYGNTTITPRVNHDPNTEKLPTRLASDVNVEGVPQNQDSSNQVIQNPPAVQSNSLPRQTPQVSKRKNVPILPANQKVLTVQHSKNVNLSTIINHISPQLGTNKRIVFIGQDTDASARKQEMGKQIIHVLPEVSVSKNLRRIQPKIVPLPKSENLTDDDKDARNVSSDPSIPKAPSIPVTSAKMVFQNGRRYIIKQSASPLKCGVGAKPFISAPKSIQVVKQNPTETKATTSTKVQLPEGNKSPALESVPREDVSPLTPSPSPSEQSNSSSCDAQTIQALPSINPDSQTYTPRWCDYGGTEQYENLSFCKGSDENLYLNVITPFKRNSNHSQVDTQAMITKCRQEMLNEFFHLPFSELKRRVDHFQDVHNEITSLLKCVADNVVREKLKVVDILQRVLTHCMDNCSKVPDKLPTDSTLDDWEGTFNNVKRKQPCAMCEKTLKPESYIPGFSNPAKNEELYCPCYKQFCQKCDMYQGNSTRFVAHHNFHSKAKPFLCPDCYQRFRTFKLLEIHTWSVCFHTLKKRVFRCKICEIDGFGDIESVTRHFAIMHSNTKIVCNVCNIVLPSITEYKYHMKSLHQTEKCTVPIRVVLCKLGQCIVRCENFMLHMEKHVVEQKLVLWFKCPFCPFVDLEAKRLMPHMQSKHLHSLTEIISPEALATLLPKDLVNAALGIKSQEAVEDPPSEFSNEDPSEDGTLLPKIINTRTITSEVFERGALEVEDTGADSEDTSAKNSDLTEQNDSASWVAQTEETGSNILSNSPGNILFVSANSDKADTLPKILEVKSIADAVSDDEESTVNKKDVETKPKSNEIVEDPGKSLNEGFAKPDPVEQPDGTVKVDKDSIDPPATVSTKTTAEQSEKAEESNDTKFKESANTESPAIIPISKPPPLARIPQHILQSNKDPRAEVSQPRLARKRTQCQSLRRFRITRRPMQRIALNGPNIPTEKELNFGCHLCGELLKTSWSVMSAHYKKSHSLDHKLCSVNPTLERMSPDFIKTGYKDLINEKKRKADAVAIPPKRRRRWNTKKSTSESRNTNSPSLGICVEQETAEDGKGNFVCKKCNLRCANMINLREHIAESHRIKGRYLICLECGDNFVVAPSLQMHLKAIHGIQDPITYMSKNTLYAPDEVEDSDEECVAAEGNQCHVCMAVFENKAAVDKHLRVHGMAFLNRKMNEARNARKSPEQTQKTENEKQKSLKQTTKEPTKRAKPAMSIIDKISATI